MRLQKIDRLVAALFERRWKNLHEPGALDDADLKFPGVYMLAHTGKKLKGRKVGCGDVFYVGMSNSAQGVADRLNQFKRGIEGGNYHSGAQRFFRDHANGRAFGASRRKSFFFVSLAVRCAGDKSQALPRDFRELGHVTCLEYYAIAHVYDETGRKPRLNKLGRAAGAKPG